VNTVNGVTVKWACAALEIARSGFYDWQSRDLSKRDCDDIALLPRIESIHRKSKETYGSPRITAELRAEGECVNEKKIARIMRENEITAQQTKRFKLQTTDSNHSLPIANRIFKTEDVNSVMAPDQVYVGDITYIATDVGFLFLAIFMDIFTRKIVGHKADDHMRADLVLEALSMALGRQDVERNRLIAHSDRGSQYASEKVRERMNLCGIIASMSRKGNCWDNAHCESFFHSLKTELVYRTKFKTREEAKQKVFEWIECWYNAERRHSALEYMAPNEYEKLAKAA